jgi:hypothetical protein
MDITLVNQIDFDCPQLARFIDCAAKFRACSESRVEFKDSTANIKLRRPTTAFGHFDLQIDISCREPNEQLSSTKRVCKYLSTVEDLHIKHQYSQQVWKNDAVENILWLQFLHPFTAVKNLYLSEEIAPGIAAALQELVGGRITEVLPRLQKMSVERPRTLGPLRETIEQFVTARRLSGLPLAVTYEVFWVWPEVEDEWKRTNNVSYELVT